MYMRDEKEGRKKQARSNKQQGKATCMCVQNLIYIPQSPYTQYNNTCIYMYIYNHASNNINVHVKLQTFLHTIFMYMYNTNCYTYTYICN